MDDDLCSTLQLQEERLRADPAFRENRKRTALARAVALAVIGYRIERHLTQSQLARELGVRQPQVERLELGEHTPTLEMLRHLSRTLGLRSSVEDADSGEEFPDPVPLSPRTCERHPEKSIRG